MTDNTRDIGEEKVRHKEPTDLIEASRMSLALKAAELLDRHLEMFGTIPGIQAEQELKQLFYDNKGEIIDLLKANAETRTCSSAGSTPPAVFSDPPSPNPIAERTAGPWSCPIKFNAGLGVPIVGPQGQRICNLGDTPWRADDEEYKQTALANAAFICHAVNSIEELTRQVDEMRKALERIYLRCGSLELPMGATIDDIALIASAALASVTSKSGEGK